MRNGNFLPLVLVLVAALAVASPAVAGSLDAGEAVQAFGATSYRMDLEAEVKAIEVLDAGGVLLADMALSFDAEEGTLIDFRGSDGTHLSMLLGPRGGSLAVTDHHTGEVEVLTAEWGEVNRGEGVELIERHRTDLELAQSVYNDLMLQVFQGELRTSRDLAGSLGEEELPISADPGSLFADGEGLTSITDGIVNPPNPCNGSSIQGYGSSFTGVLATAQARARQDANNKCTNQWCWGCCQHNSVICRQILIVITCTHYATSCSNPNPCV